jgi:hypothetical protein
MEGRRLTTANLLVLLLSISVLFGVLVITRLRQRPLPMNGSDLAETHSGWLRGVWVATDSPELEKRLDERLDRLPGWNSLNSEQQQAAEKSIHSMIRAYGTNSFVAWLEFCVGSRNYEFESDIAKQYFTREEISANQWSQASEDGQMRLYFAKLLDSGRNHWTAINLEGIIVKKVKFSDYTSFHDDDEERRYGEHITYFSSPSYLLLHSKVLVQIPKLQPAPVEGLVVQMLVKADPNDLVELISTRSLWNEETKQWIPETLIRGITDSKTWQLPF